MGGVAAGQSQSQSQASVERLLPRRHGLEEMASLPIPDELLAEILLCLPTPADVIRASGACVAFRRLVAGRSFLRRFRELHAPPLLGFLAQSRVFFPLTPPHPSAPAASAAALAADFSFSFLPGHARDYEVRDVRGGRVLLATRPASDNPSLVVCDPLHRHYILLPPTPSGWVPRSPDSRQSLLGDGEDEATGENTPSFTVVSIAQCGNKQAAFVFSSSTKQWRATPWTTGSASFSHRRYAYGCFYGVTDCKSKLLLLDTRRVTELSLAVADLPPEARASLGAGQDVVDIAIVEAGGGVTGMFVLQRYTSNISYLMKRNNGGWQLEKTIPLASLGYFFTGSSGRCLLLYHWGSTMMEPGTFTLDIKTFQLEKVFASESGKYFYSNFPPSLLSSSTI